MIDKRNRKKTIEEFSPITVGEVLTSFEDFKKILKNNLKKPPDTLLNLPIKSIVKRLSNNKVIDLMGIRRIEMTKGLDSIWLICSVNETDSIFIHENSISKLNLSTKPIGEVYDALDHFKKNFKNSSAFYELPVRIAVVKGKNKKDEKLVDKLEIMSILMDNVGSGVFCHSLVDDFKMIEENPSIEKLLDDSEKKYTILIDKLKNK